MIPFEEYDTLSGAVMPSDALDHITIRGFKSIKSIEKLPLSAVNILVGANGSGKSNFIGALSFLHEVREGRLQEYVRSSGGAEQVLHFGSKVTKQIHLDVSFVQGENQYEVAFKPAADDSLFVANEVVSFWDHSRYALPLRRPIAQVEGGREAGISSPSAVTIRGWVRGHLGRFRLYHVHDTSSSSPMRKTSHLNDNQHLRPDGANLAAFLFLVQEKHQPEYQLIRRAVQAVAPYFDDFSLRPDPLNEDSIRIAWKHKDSEQYFGAASLSDGTLRFIVLATLFLQPQRYRPAAIVIDEPELGLHPAAIAMLAALVKQASVETQVILSTQSALLLDHFEPEDVLVADRVDNATELSRVDAGRLSEWLEDYSLGQLWEKNEFGGRP